MEKRPSISVGQIFCMLFISRMVVSMTYGTLLIGDSEIWDHIVSAPVSFLITFLLLIPIYKLFCMDKKMNLMDNARELMGRWGCILIGFYIIYYLIISFHTLAIFNNFIINTVNPPISLSLLSIILLFSACYGAYKGVEALVRTAGFIFMATLLSIVFLSASLFSGVEVINFTPILYNGSESFLEGLEYMLSQSACIPALAVLFPLAQGNYKRGIVWWNTGVHAVFVVIIILITGTMGDFASTQLFPVYTAAGIGKFGSFRHLDVVYLGIWMSGIFLKLSLFLLLAGEGIKNMAGEKYRKISIIVFSILMAIFPMFYENFSILREPFVTGFLLIYLLVLTVIVPIILIILKKIPSKKEKIRIEN